MSYRIGTGFALAAVGVALVGGLTACTNQPAEQSRPTRTVTTTATPAAPADGDSSTPASSATPGSGSSGNASGSGSAAGAPSGTGEAASNTCSTSELAGSIGPGGGGAAGSVEVSIALENTGSSSCTLQGWPGVSFVGDGNGTQIGAAAVLDRDVPHGTVTLAPGASALAPLKIVRAENVPTADCSPLPADGFRVYPPGSKSSVFIPTTAYTACRASGEQLLNVQAFVQG